MTGEDTPLFSFEKKWKMEYLSVANQVLSNTYEVADPSHDT